MGALGEGWPELDSDEWVRGSWPAHCQIEPDVSSSSYSDGTLFLTNRRLVFAGRTPADELAVIELTLRSSRRSDANDTVWRSTL